MGKVERKPIADRKWADNVLKLSLIGVVAAIIAGSKGTSISDQKPKDIPQVDKPEQRLFPKPTLGEIATLIGVVVAVLAGVTYALGTVALLSYYEALGFDGHQFTPIIPEAQVFGGLLGALPTLLFGIFVLAYFCLTPIINRCEAWLIKRPKRWRIPIALVICIPSAAYFGSRLFSQPETLRPAIFALIFMGTLVLGAIMLGEWVPRVMMMSFLIIGIFPVVIQVLNSKGYELGQERAARAKKTRDDRYRVQGRENDPGAWRSDCLFRTLLRLSRWRKGDRDLPGRRAEHAIALAAVDLSAASAITGCRRAHSGRGRHTRNRLPRVGQVNLRTCGPLEANGVDDQAFTQPDQTRLCDKGGLCVGNPFKEVGFGVLDKLYECRWTFRLAQAVFFADLALLYTDNSLLRWSARTNELVSNAGILAVSLLAFSLLVSLLLPLFGIFLTHWVKIGGEYIRNKIKWREMVGTAPGVLLSGLSSLASYDDKPNKNHVRASEVRRSAITENNSFMFKIYSDTMKREADLDYGALLLFCTGVLLIADWVAPVLFKANGSSIMGELVRIVCESDYTIIQVVGGLFLITLVVISVHILKRWLRDDDVMIYYPPLYSKLKESGA